MLVSLSPVERRDADNARLCVTCVLPSAFPGIRLNDQGVCNLCAAAEPPEAIDTRRRRLSAEIDKIVEQYRGSAEYDCVVAFSGGKDSSYTLKHLVERYALKCLAITVDNGFIPGLAIENCRTVTGALGVDLLIYRPSPAFMHQLYVASVTQPIHAPAAIRRASGMCNSCIGVINNYMVKTAFQQQIPIIAGGYIGGQVPTDAAVMRFRAGAQAKARAASLQRYGQVLGPVADTYFGLPKVEDDREVVIINPMLAIGLTEEAIIEDISALGWRRVKNVGRNSSNCQLNDLGIAVHHKQYGFHPYVFEVSEQIRAGLMSRAQGLEKVGHIPEFAALTSQIRTLGLKFE
jgi:tRNA(Ile)-lysidine synthase TilS/MesJ